MQARRSLTPLLLLFALEAASAAALGDASEAYGAQPHAALNSDDKPLLNPVVGVSSGRTWLYEAPKDKAGE